MWTRVIGKTISLRISLNQNLPLGYPLVHWSELRNLYNDQSSEIGKLSRRRMAHIPMAWGGRIGMKKPFSAKWFGRITVTWADRANMHQLKSQVREQCQGNGR